MAATIDDVLRVKGSEVFSVRTSASVMDAVRLMNEHKVGCAVVLGDAGELAGIVSERDVLRRIVEDGRDPERTRVADVMTRRPWTVTGRTPIVDAIALVTQTRCRHLPVRDGERLVGMVSSGDLIAWVMRELHFEVSDLVAYIHGPLSNRPAALHDLEAMRVAAHALER